MMPKKLNLKKCPYKAIVFDLDNTLFDFSLSEKKSLKKIYHAHFKTISMGEYHDAYHQINQNLWGQVESGNITPSDIKKIRFKSLIQQFELEELLPLSDDISHSYEQHLSSEPLWLEGAKSAIESLIKTDIKLGIITNGLTHAQFKKCDQMKIFDWCQSVLISDQIGVSKPNVRIFNMMSEALDIEDPKKILMVGDSLNSDGQGALNAGWDFAWVNLFNMDNNLKNNPKNIPIHYNISGVDELVNLWV